jgi:hypothetical protein
MTPHQASDWKHLAERASKEMDSERLTELVADLNRGSGEREETSRKQQHQGNDPKSYRGEALGAINPQSLARPLSNLKRLSLGRQKLVQLFYQRRYSGGVSS